VCACKQNKKQGLGFKLGRTVVDTQKLKDVAATLTTGAALAVGYVLAMVPPSSTAVQAECSLSDAQLVALQMSATAILRCNEANATCGYNMTLSSILDGTTIGV
jgi:hypothetical protein